MNCLKKEISINSPVKKIFPFMDDLAQNGMHMSVRSMMRMGSKLKIEHLPGPEKGLGAIFRWTGKMMGLPVDFTEKVMHWKKNEKKV